MKALDRRARLRSATRDAHGRLDSMVEEAGFMADRTRYAAYLEATWRARSPIELGLTRAGAEIQYPAWPMRTIAAAIRADLEDVAGVAPRSDAAFEGEVLHYTSAQALGVLYVLEGSALGARVLAGRAAALGMSAGFGGRHLAFQASLPKAWSSFLSILEAASFDGDQEAECADAAIATFARFESAYDRAILSVPPRAT